MDPVLASGTPYWMVITPLQADDVAWYWNNLGLAGGIYAGNSLGGFLQFEPDSPAPAILVDGGTSVGVAVPEPGSALLLAGGLLLHRRRAGRRGAGEAG